MKTFSAVKFLILSCFISVIIASCKKDSESNPGDKLDLEQMGDLKSGVPIGFTNSGEPIIQPNGDQIYQWNSTLSKWENVGLPLAESCVYAMQDENGIFYCQGSFIYKLNSSNDVWEKLIFPEVSESDFPSQFTHMVASENGDAIIRLYSNNKMFYYRKKGSETAWTKQIEIDKADDLGWNSDTHPYYLCNNGNLYFATSTYAVSGGNLYYKLLNTLTGEISTLFDKNDPNMVAIFGNGGFIGPVFVNPDGTIYLMTETTSESWKAKIWKLEPSSLPATINLEQQFDLPVLKHDTDNWLTRAGGAFTVDDSENIKIYLSCQNTISPDSHWFGATMKIGSKKVNTYNDHPTGQRTVFSNLGGEAFVQQYGGNLFEWK